MVSDLELLASPQRVVTLPPLVAPGAVALGVAHEHGSVDVVMETGVEVERQVVGAAAQVNLEPARMDGRGKTRVKKAPRGG